jgi:hypothetical protein
MCQIVKCQIHAVFDVREDNMTNLMSAFLGVFNAVASEMKSVQYVLMGAAFVVCFSIASQDTFLPGIRYELFHPHCHSIVDKHDYETNFDFHLLYLSSV